MDLKTIESELALKNTDKFDGNVLSKIKNRDTFYFNQHSIKSYIHPDYPDCQVLFEKASNNITLISVVTHTDDANLDMEIYLNSFYRALVKKLSLNDYIFDWSPRTHYKYDYEFKDLVWTLLLINRRYHFFVKDVLFMIIKMIGKDYVPYRVNNISTRYYISEIEKVRKSLREYKFAVTGNYVFTSSVGFRSDENKKFLLQTIVNN